MNERQYRQVVANRRTYDPRALFAGWESAGVLRDTARRVSRQQRAAEAWARVAPTSVSDAARVRSFDDGTLLVIVNSASAGQYLRQQSAGLRHKLARVLPGIRRLRFMSGGHEFEDGDLGSA